jgi:hypothetical protein
MSVSSQSKASFTSANCHWQNVGDSDGICTCFGNAVSMSKTKVKFISCHAAQKPKASMLPVAIIGISANDTLPL